MSTVRASAVLLALLCGVGGSIAQDLGTPPQRIEIKGVRTRLLPYRLPFFDYARKLDASSNGRLRLAVQLVAAYPDVRVDDIQFRLEAGDEELPIEVAKNGVFVVPVVDRMARHDAQFSINKRRGALRANAMLWPTIARNQWTMRSVRQVAADAGAAIAPLGAWYMTPCSRSPSASTGCRCAARRPAPR
jgi:hypothetical protein